MVGDSTGSAIAGTQTAKNAVENNVLSTTSSTKRDELAEKVLQGDKSLETAKKYLEFENADKRSNALKISDKLRANIYCFSKINLWRRICYVFNEIN